MDVQEHPRSANRMHIQMRLRVSVRIACLLILPVVLSAIACVADGVPRGSMPANHEAESTVESLLRPVPEKSRPRIVIIGDSLTAGLGLATDQSFPAHLQTMLAAAGQPLEIVNAGVSGDTTAGALRRLEWSLRGNIHVLIVALGANDGMRGLAVEAMKANLGEIIRSAHARGALVLLAGMEAPPNMGLAYTEEFRSAFGELAEEYDVAFLPFLLDGVAGRPELNQSDGIHPNIEGAAKIADLLWPTLESLLDNRAIP